MAGLIDEGALLERVADDPEFLAHMVSVFVADVPTRLAAIRTALEAADAHGVERAAHSLKGALAMMAADAAAAAALRLEQAGRAGVLVDADALLTGLEAQVTEVSAALHALVRRMNPAAAV
jgi:histidine phosphotransfer protein HptB